MHVFLNWSIFFLTPVLTIQPAYNASFILLLKQKLFTPGWKYLKIPFNQLPHMQISYGWIQSSTLASLSVIGEKKKWLCRTYRLNFCFLWKKQNNSFGYILFVKEIPRWTFLLWDNKSSRQCAEGRSEIKWSKLLCIT